MKENFDLKTLEMDTKALMYLALCRLNLEPSNTQPVILL